MIEFLVTNKVVLMGALFGLSEALALIPGVKANSIFQLISNALKSALGK